MALLVTFCGPRTPTCNRDEAASLEKNMLSRTLRGHALKGNRPDEEPTGRRKLKSFTRRNVERLSK